MPWEHKSNADHNGGQPGCKWTSQIWNVAHCLGHWTVAIAPIWHFTNVQKYDVFPFLHWQIVDFPRYLDVTARWKKFYKLLSRSVQLGNRQKWDDTSHTSFAMFCWVWSSFNKCGVFEELILNLVDSISISPVGICTSTWIFLGMGSVTERRHYIVITSIMMYGVKLLIHPQTSTVRPLKFDNGWVHSYHILMGVWLLIYAGITVNSC